MTNLTGRTSFSYDDADRLTGKTWVGATNTVFTPSYDNANRLTGLTKVEGSTTLSQIGVTYNAANQVTAVTAEGDTATYAYDAAQGQELGELGVRQHILASKPTCAWQPSRIK